MTNVTFNIGIKNGMIPTSSIEIQYDPNDKITIINNIGVR